MSNTIQTNMYADETRRFILMTRSAVIARRKAAAARAVERRWRQDYIDENIDKPGKLEGYYHPKPLVTRRVKA